MIDSFIPWLVLFGQFLLVFFLLLYSQRKKSAFVQKVIVWIGSHALFLAFLVAFVSMIGSLYYSEVLEYTPCTLCWYQRILMYPQVILFGHALISSTHKLSLRALIPLNVLGALFAGYHYIIQRLSSGVPIDPSVPCTSIGGGCGFTFTFHFGYISIPLMALTGFILILVLCFVALRTKGFD